MIFRDGHSTRHKLYNELNAERYELGKTGKILFNHQEGTHDDRFWALALAVYAAEQAEPPPSRPIARIIMRAVMSRRGGLGMNDEA